MTEPVDEWIMRTWEDGETPTVLFVLDCCYGGRMIGLPRESRLSRRRHWVLAACPGEHKAYDGRLTKALAAVLRDLQSGMIDIARTVEFADLGLLFSRVNREVARLSQDSETYYRQEIATTALDRDTWGCDLPFFRNPAYRPAVRESLLDGVVPEVRRLLESVIDPEHFLSRITAGWLNPAERQPPVFRGRRALCGQLRRWARQEGPALLVITGKPGAGKSALLGWVVYTAHPKLSKHLGDDLTASGAVPSRIDHLAVVHARGRVVDDITRALVSQWHLEAEGSAPWTPEQLVEAVRRFPEPPSLVLDALDEAERPEDLLAALVLPLAAAVRDEDGSPACRMLIGMRPEDRLQSLLSLTQRLGGGAEHHDLEAVGRAAREDLRGDLEDYVAILLARSGCALPDGVPDTLATELARALVPERGQALACGEFLVAALYVRHLLRHSHLPQTPEQARTLIAGLPLDIAGILDLDLGCSAQPGRAWVRPVAAALAFAEGSGMPEPIVRLVAGAFAPGGPGKPGHPGTADADSPSLSEVKQALAELDFYLHYSVEDDGTVLYRLFHADLATALRRDPFGRSLNGGTAHG